MSHCNACGRRLTDPPGSMVRVEVVTPDEGTYYPLKPVCQTCTK